MTPQLLTAYLLPTQLVTDGIWETQLMHHVHEKKILAYQVILVGAKWTGSSSFLLFFFSEQVDSFICNVRNKITIIDQNPQENNQLLQKVSNESDTHGHGKHV
ncbi:hypothetical protein BDA96_05G039300 [Sorghum bicolor]|uniref:Uncharacterized protein n=1 Tax=Sorghum bicolor TaxID=4558 RepID=A0A921QXQ8_SORBI|nr:hypothetical protein BDA96_05G039300 [Sorghum bicolor]